jgi:Flp pilus assembly protein TadB
VVCGLFGGILLIQAGYRSALPRFYVLAFLGLLIGAGLVVSGLSIVLSLPLFFGLNGLILLASGSLTLYKYLRQTPAPPGVAR